MAVRVPARERGDGGRQRREDPVATDTVDVPGGLELGEEVLFDPRHREDDAALIERLLQLLERVDGGDVDHDVRLCVQQEPFDRCTEPTDRLQRAPLEVVGVDEAQRRVVAVDEQARHQ